jgi:hypothetical protein
LNKFVLDENIILNAANLKDVNGKNDYTCLLILTHIANKCDVIYCSKELLKKYQNKLNDLEKIRPYVHYLRMVLEQLKLQKKIKEWSYLPALDGDNIIPKNDIFIIRLTVMTNSTLVTTDSRLRSSLESKNFLRKYNIQIRHPDELKNSYLKT